MKKKCWDSIWFKLAIILVPIALYFLVDPVQLAVKRAVFILSIVDVDAAKGYILSYGIWAPIASFILMVFQSLIAPLMTTMLDAITQAQIWNIVINFAREHSIGVVVISHELDLVRKICDRVIMLSR